MTSDGAFSVAMAFGMGVLGRQRVEAATHYEEFLVRAHALGLTVEQAKAMFEFEASYSRSALSPLERCHDRLRLFAENCYLIVMLEEVLIPGTHRPPFSPWTILNGRDWMPYPYGRHFAEMTRERQRSLVSAAVALTEELGGPPQGWPLERAMNAVMPELEAGI